MTENVGARIRELIETGKEKKGVLTYKDLIEQLAELDLDSEQMDKVLDTLSSVGIEVVNRKRQAGEELEPEPEPTAEAANEEDEELSVSRGSSSTIPSACT